MEKTRFDRHFSHTTFKGQDFKGESIPSQTTDTNFGSYLFHQLLSKNWRICPLTKWKLTTHVWLGLQSSHTSMIACEKAQKTSYNSPARHMRHSLPFLTPTSLCNAPTTATLLSLQPFSPKPPGPGTSCSIPSAWTALPPHPCLGNSHSSFQSQLKCHLLLKALLDFPESRPYQPLAHTSVLAFLRSPWLLSVSQTRPWEASVQLQKRIFLLRKLKLATLILWISPV